MDSPRTAREVLEAAQEAHAEIVMARAQLERIGASSLPTASSRHIVGNLTHRIDRDLDLIEEAETLISSVEGTVPNWQVDALRMHYLEGATWTQVGERLYFSMKHISHAVHELLAGMDAARS